MRPIESAEVLLGELIQFRRGARSQLPVDELADAIRDFQEIRFNVSSSAEADGFLFQYGRENWLDLPAFVLGFTRQFDVVDQNGEHERFSQVSVEYRYLLEGDLRKVDGRMSWWFYDSGVPFAEWLSENLSDPIWRTLRDREAVTVVATQENV